MTVDAWAAGEDEPLGALLDTGAPGAPPYLLAAGASCPRQLLLEDRNCNRALHHAAINGR
jgi:hypothetical protein